MKISKQQLQKIIKEELSEMRSSLEEADKAQTRSAVAAASRSSDRSANIARTNDAELKIVSGLGTLQDYFGLPGAQVNAQFVSKLQSALDLLGDDWKEFVAASAQRAQGE